ncbi:protein hold'em [Teleopsis dalmanni]|uniref:protein hold'em n=1 Tax=Teleopsis dalmanni TaxID=139649 RepID=UPI0018CFE758|nr:protein hold'em [Teleopsis dalmanni]
MKSEPKFFFTKQFPECRGVILFTVRDSEIHFVNCKCWGSKEKVEYYNDNIKIGDIVDVISPKIVCQLNTTQQTVTSMRFHPFTTLPFLFVLNENESYINKHEHTSFFYEELHKLKNVSHKPLNSCLKLSDLQFLVNKNRPHDQFIDLLVVVAALRSVKKFKSSRTGQLLQCLEVAVVDASNISGFLLTVWHNEWIQRAQQLWKARKTILHLVDIKVSYSNFYKNTTLNITSCSLIYENPQGTEADQLQKFALTAPANHFDLFAQIDNRNLPDPNNIINQMTVKQIYARTEGDLADKTDEFTAVLYAMVTRFDIDGQSIIISKKCKACHRLLSSAAVECESDQCQLPFSLNYNSEKYEYFFNIPMHLSDHTGTLLEARLSGQIAENILGVDTLQFKNMDDKQKEILKWRFLMSHVEAKLLVKKPTALRKNLAIVIVDLKKISLETVSEKIVVF